MPRSDDLIHALGLQPHPEGGSYTEIFRSTALVAPRDGRGDRAALTTIYFLLTKGQRSRLHRVTSDEAWHFYEGDPLELVIVDSSFSKSERVTLGRLDGDTRPAHVVPAGMWQAARPLGAYALVGCTVAPGFDFADFSMLRVETRVIPVTTVRELRSAWLRPFDRPEVLVYRGDHDEDALHLGAFQDAALIGIASVARGSLPDSSDPQAWQLRGVAVHPAARGEGVGTVIMQRCMAHVSDHGGTLLWCNARVGAGDFYRRLGFTRQGKPFDVPGTGPHYVMTREM